MASLDSDTKSTAHKSRRLIVLDYVRGLAALAVVFFHRGEHAEFSSFINMIIKYGEVGANIFFVLSGYVIFMTAESLYEQGSRGSIIFIQRRIKRIYPAFLASLPIAYSVTILLKNQTFGLGDVLASATLTYQFLGFTAPQVVYWTLVYEQQFYILIAVLILPFFQKSREWLIIISSLVAVAHNSGILSNPLVNNTLPGHWYEFELGILVYFITRRKLSLWVSIPTFSILVLSGLVENYRTQAAGLFACLMLILVFTKNFNQVASTLAYPLKSLGMVSYSLYLLHLPGFTIADSIFTYFSMNDSLLKYFAGIGAAFILAIISFLFFEKPFFSSNEKAGIFSPKTETLESIQ